MIFFRCEFNDIQLQIRFPLFFCRLRQLSNTEKIFYILFELYEGQVTGNYQAQITLE